MLWGFGRGYQLIQRNSQIGQMHSLHVRHPGDQGVPGIRRQPVGAAKRVDQPVELGEVDGLDWGDPGHNRVVRELEAGGQEIGHRWDTADHVASRQGADGGVTGSAMYKEIATALKVSEGDVALMDSRLSGPDSSLNAPLMEDESGSADRQDFLVSNSPLPDEMVSVSIDDERRVTWLHSALDVLSERELKIIRERRLQDDGATLEALGTKLGMTQLWDEHNRLVPVTVIQAGPCVVTQVRTPETDGYSAVQLGYGAVKAKKVTKGRPVWLNEIEDHLAEALQTPVSVKYGRKRSKITIDCQGREEFERVYELLKSTGAGGE